MKPTQHKDKGFLRLINEFDEVQVEIKDRNGGSSNYTNLMFICSKCKKQYTTLGALRYYHFKNAKRKCEILT